MSSSDKFLRAFSSIEKWLRSLSQLDRGVGFYPLVDCASAKNAAVRRYRTDLKEYADLRNAIVHERSDGHIIAEPNSKAVSHLEALEKLLLAPPKVMPIFQLDVYVADYSAPLTRIVSRMSSRQFSQIPVIQDDKFVGVLTTNTISRWLGSHAEDGMALLDDTVVGQVLEHAEFDKNYKFVNRLATLFDVLEAFDLFERTGRPLDAVLITEKGKATSSFLGIITIYDIPKILSKIEVNRVSKTSRTHNN